MSPIRIFTLVETVDFSLVVRNIERKATKSGCLFYCLKHYFRACAEATCGWERTAATPFPAQA
jgi:hypothetical protein